MSHHESGSLDSGSLDNSDCKRLRISSLVTVDMPAEEDTYGLYGAAIELVDEMRSRGFDSETDMWNNLLDTAFRKDDAGAFNTVFERLRHRFEAHNARQRQGGPAAAVPSTLVSDPAPPANSAPASSSSYFASSSTRSCSSLRACRIGFITATSQASLQKPRPWRRLLAAARRILRKVD